ncbi:MAG TPA: NADH-quinone oxidoreductase subunit C, partial [Chitinophagaceae bacterium]|nr:NADH-quinone oxidoreductase subunit C [Chitinophagaceae bacterium]
MTNEYIQQKLSDKFGTSVWGFEETFGIFAFYIKPDINMLVLKYLNEEQDLGFQFLTDITAVHFPDKKDEELCVVYHLHNLVANKRIRIRASVPVTQPDIASATPLYSGANWMERETYDFFGVNFTGHPNLVRILNVDEMNYFPMRKEYPMEDPTRTDKDDEMFGRG